MGRTILVGVLAFVAGLATAGGVVAWAVQPPATAFDDVDRELMRLESGKWAGPGGGVFAHPGQMLALMRDDVLFVEYDMTDDGSAVSPWTVRRDLPAELARTPLPMPKQPPAIGDYRIVRASEDVRILSYRARIPEWSFDAWATTVWARDGSGWKTVYYQASLTR